MEELLHAILPYLSESGQQRTLSAAHEALSQVPHNPPLEVPSTSTFNDLGGLEVDSRVVVPPKTHLRDLALSANVCQLSSSSETCSEREFQDFCHTLGEIPNSLRMEERAYERQGPTLPPVPRTVPAANAFSFSEAGPSNRNLLSSPYSPCTGGRRDGGGNFHFGLHPADWGGKPFANLFAAHLQLQGERGASSIGVLF